MDKAPSGASAARPGGDSSRSSGPAAEPAPPFERVAHLFRRMGLRGRLLLALLPSIVGILLFTGYASYHVSEEYIHIALARTVKMQTLALAHELEQYLETCREDLLFLSRGSLAPEDLRGELERRVAAGSPPYFELAFLPAGGAEPVVLVQRGGRVRLMTQEDLPRMQPNPLLELQRFGSLAPGEVRLSSVLEAVYPMPDDHAANLFVRTHVFRMQTAVPATQGHPAGIVFLSIEARHLRDILSLYNSRSSPLWDFPRSPELRFNYLFDTEGWILFQSEDNPEKQELTTFLARENYEGTLGRQGQDTAFRPNDNHTRYWEAVREGQRGLDQVADGGLLGSSGPSHFFSYVPIRFQSLPGRPGVVAGVANVDRSQLPIVAGYKHLDVMLLVTAGSVVLIAVLILCFGRLLTSPLQRLAQRMDEMHRLDALEEIDLPTSSSDVASLQRSINNIIRRFRRQVEEIRAKDEAILNVNKREPADLRAEFSALNEAELSLVPEIIGQGPVISGLKADILKAAQADVDVLISGETGTGKQLIAEAIHAHSVRSACPFVSINCGALDENLLLDALFGHIKGAFTEARTDRKGAFLEAGGGILFLDEIQSASPKVQQSLLRALATRKIKPLGSDKEVDINVRIIAATNVDIPSLIEERLFREDLYYRLKVVSITAPPLRSHPENIPLLGVYYLRQAMQLTGRAELTLSKGALAKLIHYHWPGNVRELVNSITRAAVMAETEIIQPEEIRLEESRPFPLALNVSSRPEDGEPGTDQGPDQGPEPGEDGPSAYQEKGRPGTRGAGRGAGAQERQAPPEADEEGQPLPGAASPGARVAPPAGMASQQGSGPTRPTPATAEGEAAAPAREAVQPLNERQAQAWKTIRTRRSVTRKEYQEIVGGRLPTRTAIYDLQDLVRRGLLVKKGRGPSTRYERVSPSR
jgi:DNA-binding NtrC family response regulator